MPRTGDCSESSEVSPRSFPGSPVSRGGGGLAVFPGFSIAGTRRQASVNSQRISLLRRSSNEYLALAARHTVLSLPSRSWRPPPCEVSPAMSPPGLGLSGPVSQDSLDSSLPQGSSVVARPSPSLTGCLRTWTFGPTPQTWVGELIWVLSLLQAFGMQSKPLCPSTLESFWPSGRVSSTSALLWSRRMWRYFAITPQQCRISARRGAQGRRSSTPWLRGFSVGRSPSPSDCYPSSFRGP